MSLDLILLKPSGEHERLNFLYLYESCIGDLLIKPWIRQCGTEITPEELGAFSARCRQLLQRYRLYRPEFPRAALLEFTELGPSWVQRVDEANVLYNTQSPDFVDVIDEINATIQIDMEEEHMIPYAKHRHYDTIICFKADIDRVLWQGDPDLPVINEPVYNDLLEITCALENAVERKCSAVWFY